MTVFGETVVPKDKNLLMRGDNLSWLKRMDTASIDMAYMDPPFNSDRKYNMTFDGDQAHLNAQIVAFDDTWMWTPAVEQDFKMDVLADDAVKRWGGNDDVIDLLIHWHKRLVLKKGAVRKVDQTKREALMAYLYAIAPRLLETHRVLRPGGAIYIHCDDTAGAYLRQLLDSIFGEAQYRNEIIWKRTAAHSNTSQRYGRVHDVILYFVKDGGTQKYNKVYTPYEPSFVEKTFCYDDGDGKGRYQKVDMQNPAIRPNLQYEWNGFPHPANGWKYSKETMQRLHNEGRIWYPSDKTKRPRLKNYLTEAKGQPVQDIISDIVPLSSHAKERLGYPTQKPIALLERLITVSTNEGDTVLDPFAGCFTTIEAAWKLKRRFIGIDIAWQGVRLAEERLAKAGAVKGTDFLTMIDWAIHEAGAYENLAEEDKRTFQDMVLEYALSREHPVIPNLSRGADGGWDGYIPFTRADGERGKVLVSVKGGKKKANDVDSLIGVAARENAEMGLLIQLETPTKEQVVRARNAGFIIGVDGEKVDKIQIATVNDLIDDDPRTGLVMPSSTRDPLALF